MITLDQVLSSSSLPTLPAVAVKLVEVSRDPNTDVNQIVQIVKSDPAICGKILKSANSTYFGFSSKVTSIERAVPLLGTTVVTSLALSFSLSDDTLGKGKLARCYRDYWLQSLCQSAACELVSSTFETSMVATDYLLAGLMMDVGRLAMLKTASREYYPVLEVVEEKHLNLPAVEEGMLGFTHCQVGAKLIESWGLPSLISEAILAHHIVDDAQLNSIAQNGDSLMKAMIFSAAAGDYYCQNNSALALKRLRDLGQLFYNVDEQQVEDYLTELRTRIDVTGELYCYNTSVVPPAADLMAEANQQLVLLTMRAQAESTQAKAREELVSQQKAELESQNKELSEQATTDPLTKVYNRNYFETKVKQEVKQSLSRCTPIGMIFLDVDKFKLLNDNYGHQFGDEVLQGVAGVLKRNVRKSDTVARYGGEEFVVVVDSANEKGIQRFAERLRGALESEVFNCNGTRVPVTASFGVAMGMPSNTSSDWVKMMIEQADAAMYDSKQNGRNQVHFRNLLSEEETTQQKLIQKQRFSRWLVQRQIIDIPKASEALVRNVRDDRTFDQIAVELGFLTSEQVDFLDDAEADDEERTSQLAIIHQLLSDQQVATLHALQIEVPSKVLAALISLNYIDNDAARVLLLEYERQTLPSPELVQA